MEQERARQLWAHMMTMARHLIHTQIKVKAWFDMSRHEQGLAFTEWTRLGQFDDGGMLYSVKGKLAYAEHSRLKTEVYVALLVCTEDDSEEMSGDWRLYCGCGWDDDPTDMFRAE